MNHYENIPVELMSLDQWVCTRSDSKVPMQAVENAAASSIDPSTWSPFDTALNAVSEGHYDYLGFVFADNGIVGIDIDRGYDEEGFITPVAADILKRCGSYTERSKSGRGFHVLIRGDLPFKGKNNLNGLEIYRSSRYFIMTGDTLLYQSIVKNQEAIDYVVETFFQTGERDGDSKSIGTRIYSPIWEKPENGRIRLRPVYPRITPGSRNTCLTSLAGLLHNQGYEKEQIYDELLYANKVACDPMLPINEIQTIVSSVTRYKR